MKYKIGDKVRVRDDIEAFKEYKMDGSKNLAWVTPGMLKFRGETLTITKIDRYGMYSVNEDNGDWCWVDEMFSGLVTDRLKVIITTDGKTTTAKMYEGKKVLKTAKTQCSPEDTFDFAVGAKLALERVTEKDLKFKVGQFVRVIDNSTCQFVVGQPVEITSVLDDLVMCKGYLKRAKTIGTQLLRHEMIKSLQEEDKGCNFCKFELEDYPYISAQNGYDCSGAVYEPAFCPLCGKCLKE